MSTEDEVPTFVLACVDDGPAAVPSSEMDVDCGHRVHISNSTLDAFLDLVQAGKKPRTVCLNCFEKSIPDIDEELKVVIPETLVQEFATLNKMSPEVARRTLESIEGKLRRFREEYRQSLAGGSEH